MPETTPTITTFAEFPKRTMLENLAVRADGSVLVVASPQRPLWYAPAPSDHLAAEPVLLHTFEEGQLAQSLVEKAALAGFFGDIISRLGIHSPTYVEPYAAERELA
jgi:hypothetical protein